MVVSTKIFAAIVSHSIPSRVLLIAPHGGGAGRWQRYDRAYTHVCVACGLDPDNLSDIDRSVKHVKSHPAPFI